MITMLCSWLRTIGSLLWSCLGLHGEPLLEVWSEKLERAWEALQGTAFRDNKAKGFHPEPVPELGSLRGTQELMVKIMLVVCELAEVAEELRKNPCGKSEKLPSRLAIEEELADAIIRIADLSGAFGLNIGRAIVEKLMYNRTRPHRHGKKF